MQIPGQATLADLVVRFGVPFESCFLVLVNGLFLPPAQRRSATFAEGDVSAVWPPVAGG